MRALRNPEQGRMLQLVNRNYLPNQIATQILACHFIFSLEVPASPPLFFSITSRPWPRSSSGGRPRGGSRRCTAGPPVEFDAGVRTLAHAERAEELRRRALAVRGGPAVVGTGSDGSVWTAGAGATPSLSLHPRVALQVGAPPLGQPCQQTAQHGVNHGVHPRCSTRGGARRQAGYVKWRVTGHVLHMAKRATPLLALTPTLALT